MSHTLTDNAGVKWRKVLSGRALDDFTKGHVILIAEVDKSKRIVNDNWLLVLRHKEEHWYADHHFATPRYGHACHHVRDKVTSGNVYTYIRK